MGYTFVFKSITWFTICLAYSSVHLNIRSKYLNAFKTEWAHMSVWYLLKIHLFRTQEPKKYYLLHFQNILLLILLLSFEYPVHKWSEYPSSSVLKRWTFLDIKCSSIHIASSFSHFLTNYQTFTKISDILGRFSFPGLESEF